MARKILIALSVIAITLAYVGCTEKTTPPTARDATSTFPLNVGDRWEYIRSEFSYSYIDSIPADTMMSMHYRHVVGIDTLDSLGIMAMVDDSIISMVDTMYNSITRRWLKIDDNKLKEYAILYLSPGSPPLIVYSAPYTLLDFPLDRGKSWNVQQEYPIVNRLSKVVGPAGKQYNELTYDCDLVLSADVIVENGDTVSQLYDWYTDLGLISQEIDQGKMYRRGEMGEIIDSTHDFEKTILLSMYIDSVTIQK